MADATLNEVTSELKVTNKKLDTLNTKTSTERAKEAENLKEQIRRDQALLDLLSKRQTVNVSVDGEKPKGSFFGSLISALGFGTAALGTLALGALSGYLAQYKKMFLDPIFGTKGGGAAGRRLSVFHRFFSKLKNFFILGFAGARKILDNVIDVVKTNVKKSRLFRILTRIKNLFTTPFTGIGKLLSTILGSVGTTLGKGGKLIRTGLFGMLTKIKNFFMLDDIFRPLVKGLDEVTDFFAGKSFKETKLGGILMKIKNIFTLKAFTAAEDTVKAVDDLGDVKKGSAITRILAPLGRIFTAITGIDGAFLKYSAKVGKPISLLFSGIKEIGKGLGRAFVPLGFLLGAFDAVDDGFKEFEKLKKDRGDLSDEAAMTAAIAKGFTTLASWTILGLPELVYSFVKWSAEKFAEYALGPETAEKVKNFFGTKNLGELLYDNFVLPLIMLLPKILSGEAFVSKTRQEKRIDTLVKARQSGDPEQMAEAERGIRRDQLIAATGREGLRSGNPLMILAAALLGDTRNRSGDTIIQDFSNFINQIVTSNSARGVEPSN